MPAGKRQCASFLLAFLLAPVLAHADFSDDYIAGLAALDNGQYASAVKYLQRALAARATSSTPVEIDGNPQPYLPHHFLGMAQYKTGDCAAAKVEWNDPANLRSLGRLRQLRAQEEQLLAQCKSGSGMAEAAVAKPEDTRPAAAEAAPTPPAPVQPATAEKAAVQKTPVVVPAPPALLVRAFDDLVAGRYASVVRMDAAGIADTRARFQAYLLRSAARFAQSRSGDTGQIDAARRDARAAKALDKSAPDERMFSPAFRAFYAAAQ
ncbi:MAG: hypothetical protein JSS28_11300 [Proteobacteria bacterium]|nr:hypothetical protein [Pseudomonadota bacterium]